MTGTSAARAAIQKATGQASEIRAATVIALRNLATFSVGGDIAHPGGGIERASLVVDRMLDACHLLENELLIAAQEIAKLRKDTAND